MIQTRTAALWKLWLAAGLSLTGCAQTRSGSAVITRSAQDRAVTAPANAIPAPHPPSEADHRSLTKQKPDRKQEPSSIQLTSAEQPAAESPQAKSADTTPESSPQATATASPLQLDEVIQSVLVSYPLLQSAIAGREIAEGELVAASGEFDLKLKADSMNMGHGFYDNYRHSVGAEQPLFSGGSVFGGYRLGTGSYPSYYQNRETHDGGEFKAGVTLPLLQNRDIDDRRAGVWRNGWGVQAVEPEIQTQLIEFIRAASVTYWYWVAAGQNVQVTESLLKNATDRNEGLQRRVQSGDAPAIELTDNERLIVSRRTKLLDAQRKLQQSSYKLSLFLRDASGQPVVVSDERLPPAFPGEDDPAQRSLDADIQQALERRPEMQALSILREQLQIDLATAQNMQLPQLDAVVAASQDVGAPADAKKNDKQLLELEGGLVASVPLQRRKALGKAQAVEGKLAQVQAKTQFTQNKIVAEVQTASAALHVAYQQLGLARQSLALARQMEIAERRKFDLGDSNLLLVNLREQATADAAATEVEAQLNYFEAQAEYRAALASDATAQ